MIQNKICVATSSLNVSILLVVYYTEVFRKTSKKYVILYLVFAYNIAHFARLVGV